MQASCAGGFAFYQIFAFAGVGAKVVELEMTILEEFDQFPIAQTDRGCGPATLVAVMRVMPEQRTPGWVAVFEKGAKRDAIHRARLDVHGFAEGWEEIDA